MDQSQNGIINPAVPLAQPGATPMAKPMPGRRPMTKQDGTPVPDTAPIAIETAQFGDAFNDPLPQNPQPAADDPATLQEAAAAAGQGAVPGAVPQGVVAPGAMAPGVVPLDPVAQNVADRQAYADEWLLSNPSVPATTLAEDAANAKAPTLAGDRQIAGGAPNRRVQELNTDQLAGA